MDINKLLELLLSMADKSKDASAWRYVAALITILLVVVLWRLPEIITALNAGQS